MTQGSQSNASVKIAHRLHLFFSMWDKLCKGYPQPAGIYLNRALVANCVERYFVDLSQTKDGHDIAYADAHKRAAFTLKWICRIRPVQIDQGTEVGRVQLLINELFAVFVALEFLQVSFANIDKNYLRNLMYTLRHRDFDAETLSSEMYLLERAFGHAGS